MSLTARNFFEFWEALEGDTALTGTQVLVALAFAKHYDWKTHSPAWPSLATVARLTHLNERTVRRSIEALVRGGWMIPDGTATKGVQRFMLNQPDTESTPDSVPVVKTLKTPDSLSVTPDFVSMTPDRESDNPSYIPSKSLDVARAPGRGEVGFELTRSRVVEVNEALGKFVIWLEDSFRFNSGRFKTLQIKDAEDRLAQLASGYSWDRVRSVAGQMASGQIVSVHMPDEPTKARAYAWAVLERQLDDRANEGAESPSPVETPNDDSSVVTPTFDYSAYRSSLLADG